MPWEGVEDVSAVFAQRHADDIPVHSWPLSHTELFQRRHGKDSTLQLSASSSALNTENQGNVFLCAGLLSRRQLSATTLFERAHQDKENGQMRRMLQLSEKLQHS